MDARAPDRKKGFLSGAYFCCPSLLHETIHSGGRLVPLQTMPPQEIGNLPIPQYLQGGVGVLRKALRAAIARLLRTNPRGWKKAACINYKLYTFRFRKRKNRQRNNKNLTYKIIEWSKYTKNIYTITQ